MLVLPQILKSCYSENYFNVISKRYIWKTNYPIDIVYVFLLNSFKLRHGTSKARAVTVDLFLKAQLNTLLSSCAVFLSSSVCLHWASPSTDIVDCVNLQKKMSGWYKHAFWSYFLLFIRPLAYHIYFYVVGVTKPRLNWVIF